MGDKNIVDQRRYTENELARYFKHVAPTDVLYAPSRVDEGQPESAVDWLSKDLKEYEKYLFFGIRGGVSGINHATAICLAPGNESFFDPNLGIFEFVKKPVEMFKFLNEHIFPQGGPARGLYIGNPKKVFYDVERIRCGL